MKTTTFTAANSDTAITTTIWTKSVVIMEDPSVASWPTTDYLIKIPLTSNTAIRRLSGTAFEISSETGFKVGQVVGYVAIVTGASTTFQMIEQGI